MISLYSVTWKVVAKSAAEACTALEVGTALGTDHIKDRAGDPNLYASWRNLMAQLVFLSVHMFVLDSKDFKHHFIDRVF